MLPALLTLLFGAPAFADVYSGFVAYSSGDYATVLKEWEPLAEQSDAAAQFNGNNCNCLGHLRWGWVLIFT